MLIARDLARCLEPSLLAYAAGVVLDSWQVDLLTSTSKRLIVLYRLLAKLGRRRP
jgi:hypothetical protein